MKKTLFALVAVVGFVVAASAAPAGTEGLATGRSGVEKRTAPQKPDSKIKTATQGTGKLKGNCYCFQRNVGSPPCDKIACVDVVK